MLREKSMVKTTKSRLSLIQHCTAVSAQKNITMCGCMCNDGCSSICNRIGDFYGTSARNHKNVNISPSGW